MSSSTGTTNKQTQGKVAELEGHVYVLGEKHQADKYIKTTEAIAEYVGREYSKDMKLLVKGTENAPEEPPEPAKSKKEENPYEVEKYKMNYTRYMKRNDLYQENKAKVFLIIKGQCTLAMKTKVEGLAGYIQLETDDNVIGLLKVLRELAFSTMNANYGYWTSMRSLKAVLDVTQEKNQGLASYYRSWSGTLEVAEEQFGKINPKVLGKDTAAVARNKVLACIFLDGADKDRYGQVVTELHNNHLTGNGKYPVSVEGMMTLLSHRTENLPAKGGKDEDTGSLRSFAQSGPGNRMRCYKCGKKGHRKKNCPMGSGTDQDEGDTSGDDNSDASSHQSHTRERSLRWSG
jgi:hypothetical protein